jgi:hypothetical protein
MPLMVIPTTLKKANDFVSAHHRHSNRTARDGGRFAIAAMADSKLVGVAIVGNPLSATYMDGFTSEVLRVCVSPEAPKNTCSMLYGACWRAWKAMGGRKMITYTLQSETGASLRAAGWLNAARTKGTGANWNKSDHLSESRQKQDIYQMSKYRWEIYSKKQQEAQ